MTPTMISAPPETMTNSFSTSDMMGGAFGLEQPRFDNFPHPEGTCCAWVSSGRAALACLLDNMPRPRRVLVPRLICDTILEPLRRAQLPLIRYSCTEQLEAIAPDDADTGDLLLLVNYFGLTGDSVRAAALRHPGPVVVDATTSLYTPPLPGIPAFYSPRKFGGLCDGGIATAPFPLRSPKEADSSSTRALALLERTERGAAATTASSEAAERSLSAAPRRMSPLTRTLIQGIDWVEAARRRLENYAILHAALAPINRLHLPCTPSQAPMCYPLVCGIPGLRDELIDAGIVLPLYWPEVIEATSASDTENRLARSLLPLPLDQRYNAADMQRLLRLIQG